MNSKEANNGDAVNSNVANPEREDLEALAKRDADFDRLDDRVEVQSLQKRLEQAETEATDHKDKYLRALAELENLKKRSLKDRADLLKYQGDRIFSDLLQVIDNLELALQHAEADPSTLKDGIQLIHKLFVDTLGKWDVRSESAVGKEFDPTKHSALSRVPSADQPPGTVINEFRRAYFYKDKLLRPGEVVVAMEDGPQAGGLDTSAGSGGSGG